MFLTIYIYNIMRLQRKISNFLGAKIRPALTYGRLLVYLFVLYLVFIMLCLSA